MIEHRITAVIIGGISEHGFVYLIHTRNDNAIECNEGDVAKNFEHTYYLLDDEYTTLAAFLTITHNNLV
jgi:hypothetical protein